LPEVIIFAFDKCVASYILYENSCYVESPIEHTSTKVIKIVPLLYVLGQETWYVSSSSLQLSFGRSNYLLPWGLSFFSKSVILSSSTLPPCAYHFFLRYSIN
jgi:hypothetical protein